MKRNPLSSLTRVANRLKANLKSVTDTKSPDYLYTEDDLGEDILNAGITYTYKAIKHHFVRNPFIHMLRPQTS